MAAQSFAMGQAFGTSFQYGKRKISSMSNEEFNNLTPQMAHANIQSDVRQMIPSMNQTFKVMEQFQLDIINSMVNTMRLGLEQLGQWITTGKTGTETQTETNFTNIDYSDTGTFEVGSSRGTTQVYPRNLKGYEQWLLDNNIPEVIAKKKAITVKNTKRLTTAAIAANKANQAALTAPKVNVRVQEVKRSSTSAVEQYYINKKRIQANISTIKKQISAANKNYNTQRIYAKTRMQPSKRGSYMQQMGFRLTNTLKDLNTRLARELRLLRNYARNP